MDRKWKKIGPTKNLAKTNSQGSKNRTAKIEKRTCFAKIFGMSSKSSQHAKARKANAFKAKKTNGVSKKRSKGILFQMDTGTRAERKSLDTVTSLAPPLTSSFTAATLLNGLAQGTGTNERVGRKTTLKSVQLRYTHIPTSGGPDSQVRIAIIYDKQPNGALPAASDIFNQANFNSHLNLANSDRFVVIMDEISESSQSSLIGISGQRYVKCNLETIYGGTTNGIASINSGSLMILAANNADPTIGAVSSLFFNVRIRYTDV